jgi:hypothetical protein
MDRFSPPDDRRPLRIMPDKLDEPEIDSWKIRRDTALEERAEGGERDNGKTHEP